MNEIRNRFFKEQHFFARNIINHVTVEYLAKDDFIKTRYIIIILFKLGIYKKQRIHWIIENIIVRTLIF